MKSCDPEAILASIRSSYFRQFEHELDVRLLNHVVLKEIQKKKEAFLQIQLSSNGLGFDKLLKFKDYLRSQSELQGSEIRSNSLFAESKQVPVGKRPSQRQVGEKASKAKLKNQASLGLSEQDKKLRQKEYARQYYQKKKAERQAEEGVSSAKRFKTTPEQRAYQRAYYKRRKQQSSRSQEDRLFLGREQQEQFNEAELFSAGLRTANDLEQQPHTSGHSDEKGARNSSVDYKDLAADMLAIDHAFRANSSVDAFDLAKANSVHSQPRGSMGRSPRTKLRKAKQD